MVHTVIHNMLYLIDGMEGNVPSTYKKTVMSTSIPQLLDACLQPSTIQWKSLSIPDFPHYLSAAASLGGCLLVIGGQKGLLTWIPKPNSVITSVYAYCLFTSSWVLVGKLPQPLCLCMTATLPTDELLVIGGVTPSAGIATNTTYKYSLPIPAQ